MKKTIEFNISDYSEVLMQDKLNMIVLAWIEKSGSTIDTELVKELGISAEKLSIILLKLYNNQLITVGDNNFKISVRGKHALDTLNISKNIINDTCKYLSTENSKELIKFRNYYSHYRDNFYDDYLHTQTSIKLWTRILDTEHFKKTEDYFKIYTTNLLVFYDLWEHTQHKNLQDDTILELKLLLDNYKPSIKEKHQRNKYRLNWKIDDITTEFKEIKESDLSELPMEKKEFYEFLYYRNFLRNKDLESKYTRYFLAHPQNNLSENTFITYTKFKDYCSSAFKFKKLSPRNLLNIDFTKESNKELESLYTVSFLLKQATTIQDLSQKLQSTTDISRRMLKEISENIKRLQKT